MSMQAYVIGFGPFNSGLVEYMDFPTDWYDDVAMGDEVIVQLFHCGTTEQSKRLAEVLGVEPFRLGNHAIPHNSQINWAELHKMVEDSGVEWTHSDVEGFEQLLGAGFKCFYYPGA